MNREMSGSWSSLPRHQVFVRLPAAHDRVPVAVDQNLGGARSRVVVGRHDEAVGAGAPYRPEVFLVDAGQLAILGEKVARLTDRADYVDGLALAPLARLVDGNDLVIRAVERRPDQVVHRAVD